MPQLVPVFRSIFLSLFLLTIMHVFAQGQDTTVKQADTLHQRTKPANISDSIKAHRQSNLHHDSSSPPVGQIKSADSVSRRPVSDSMWIRVAGKYIDNFRELAFRQNQFFGFSNTAAIVISDRKEFEGKELLFYAMIALLLLFASIRVSFPKYFVDLFRVAFRTTLKQRQIGEQLIQTPLPSLLLNCFFMLSSGLYLDFVLQHFHLTNGYNFWLLYLYCFVGLGLMYVVKYLSLKFSGWIFNISSTTDGYIFIVFMINKIMGIYLLPFLILLAFTDNIIYIISFTLSYLGVFFLLAYRFILAYGLIKSQMRLNTFHFFLYLCAFEVVPLFLVYKALMRWF